MTRIAATVRDGVIVPREPIDWPEGTEVEVSAVSDDDRPESPEEIEAWIAEWNAIPTPTMTEEEWAAFEADRKAQRDYDMAMAPIREAKINKYFE